MGGLAKNRGKLEVYYRNRNRKITIITESNTPGNIIIFFNISENNTSDIIFYHSISKSAKNIGF